MKKTIFLTLLLTVMFVGSANAADPNLYMPYDDSPDDIIVPITGVPVGDTLSYVEGVVNNAVHLNGTANGIIDSGIDYTVDITCSEFTVALWAKYGQVGVSRSLICSGLFTMLDSTKYGVGGGSVSLGTGYINFPPAFEVGTWKHFVVTYDGTVLRVYSDGAEITNSTSKYPSGMGAVTGTGGTISVGYNPEREASGEENTEWPGDVDELKIYNYAMDAAAVTALYASYMGPDAPPEITAQPFGGVVAEGDPYTGLTVAATNPYTADSSGLEYLWYKDTVSTGITTANLDITAAVPGDAGDYYCEVTITSNGQMVASDTVSLIVTPIPTDPNLPVLHMPYDGSPDDIIVPLTGTVVGTTPSYVTGVLNDAVQLTGAAYDSGIDYAANILCSEFTVAMWSRYGQNGMNRFLINSDMIGVSDSSNGEGDITVFVADNYIGHSGVFDIGTWQHLVFTYDGQLLTIYVDGAWNMDSVSNPVPRYNHPNGMGAVTGSGNINVGYVPGRADSEWIGAVDDLKIYKYAMDAPDVTALYASYMGPDAPPEITAQPVGGVVAEGDPYTGLAVVATNPYTADSSGLEYLWYKDSVSTGITTANLDIAAAVPGDAGDYYCDVTITSNSQMVASDTVSLIVTAIPTDPNLPVLHMPYDGSPDDIIVPLTGTVVGTPPSYVTGLLNDAVQLTGVAYDSGIDYAANIACSEFTVALWSRYDNMGINHALLNSGLFAAFDNSSGPGNIVVILADNYIQGPCFEVGKWKHLVFTYDGQLLTIYADGAELMNSSSKYPSGMGAITGSGNINVGYVPGRADSEWIGAVDDLKIYKYAMTAFQVEDLYTEICVDPPAYDYTGDCKVNLDDFAAIAGEWLEVEGSDMLDLEGLISEWLDDGTEPTSP